MNGVLLGVLISLSAFVRADPVKKGKVLCEGGECDFKNVPAGSLIQRAGDFAQDFQDRVKKRIELEKNPNLIPSIPPKTDQIRISKSLPVTSIEATTIQTNLPTYHQGVDRSHFEASEKVILVPKASDVRMRGLKSGDIVWAVVDQEIVASPTVPTPIRAQAIGGAFRGGFFLGEAILDRELKRVLFSFTKLRFKDIPAVYSLKASGLSPRGSVGLEGEYVSQAGKFLIAELASAGAAGFMDSTIQRNQNAFGNYVQAPSLTNSGKTAAAAALSKTTEQMAESVRSAPEYTQTQGYQEIQIIIQEDPVESGN